jgi:hypothetical protein
VTTPSRDTSRNETPSSASRAAPGCHNPLPRQLTGRPARFCSGACRARAHRYNQTPPNPITVEVDRGSTSSKGRPPDQQWLIRLRRGNRRVIIAIGLTRTHADDLADQITELPTTTPLTTYDRGMSNCQGDATVIAIAGGTGLGRDGGPGNAPETKISAGQKTGWALRGLEPTTSAV